MFDSQILEVVIGLIFVFLLFSLLATSFQELIANFRNSRGKMLREAIYDMTGETKPKHYRKSQTLVATILLILAGMSLAFTQFGIKPPSFLDNFVSQYKMVILWHSWIFLLFSFVYLYVWGNYYQKNLSRTNRAPENELAKQILGSPRYTRLGRQKSIDKHTAYIPGGLFSKIFVEVIGEQNIALGKFDKIPYNDREDDWFEVEPQTQKILRQFHKESMGNVTLFGAQVEQWFDDTMSQVQGWYKREAQRWLFFIGLMLGLFFNINPFQVSKHLNESDEGRKVLMAAAESISMEPSKEGDTPFRVDLAQQLNALEQSFRAQQMALKNLEKELPVYLEEAIENEENIADTALQSILISKTLTWAKEQILLDSTANHLYTQGEELSQYIHQIGRKSSLMGIGWNEQNLAYWNENNHAQIFIHFLGLFIFAIAISLGAPFWFDLLNRFVHIRHAGTRPRSSKDTQGTIEG